MNLVTDKHKFIQWYTDNHTPIAKFKEPWSWFDKVELNSQELRKRLGNVTLYDHHELERSEDERVSQEAIVGLATTLQRHIPLYFVEYEIDWYHFTSPFFLDGKRKIKWGKHVNRWMFDNPQPEPTVKKVESLLSEMGAVWASHAAKKMDMYVAISTDPRAFASIGHTNVDAAASCFKTGCLNEVNKFVIGQTPNAFVGFVSDKPININKLSYGIIQRFWGIADESYKAFHIFNTYPKEATHSGSVNKAISETFLKLIGSSSIEVSKNTLTVQGVFYNPNSNISYSDPKFKWNYTEAKFDTDGLWHMQCCMRCHEVSGPHRKIEQVELGFYCHECIAAYGWTCELTGRLTLSNKNIIKYKGKHIRVSRVVYEEQCEECCHTGDHYLKNDLGLDTTGNNISIDYAKATDMKECPSCERWNAKNNQRCGTCRKSLQNKKESALL